MIKFSTLAYSVLLIVLVALHAQANTCADLFVPADPLLQAEHARLYDNLRVVRKLDPATRALLINWFSKNEVIVQIKPLPSLGESTGNKILIDETLARYPRVIGTIVHEIYHTTVTAKLTPTATATEISRAIWFSLEKSALPTDYARLHRADEYEARIKQMAILRLNKMKNDAAKIESTAETFRREQEQATEMLLAFFDEVKISKTEDPGDPQRKALKLSLAGDVLYVPIVREIADERAYAHAALEKRHLSLSKPARKD